jgi:hypothetical protein
MGLSYRPARLHRLAESIPGLLESLKIPSQVFFIIHVLWIFTGELLERNPDLDGEVESLRVLVAGGRSLQQMAQRLRQ